MARSSRGTPLSWGIVFLAICGLWLILMVSNRSLALPLFFLGRFTVNLPVGFWLFGAFVVGNVVSLGILSFLQWTIVRLAQDFSQGRSGGRFEEIPPRKVGRAAPEPEWEEDEFDWEEPPQRPTPSPSPVQSAQTHQPQPPQTQTQADRIKTDRSPEEGSRNPEETPDATPVPPLETEGKVYEAPPPPRQGKQEGSSYSYQYRPARRAQEPMDPPSAQSARPSPSRPPQAGGVRQKVVDVNYRVINPGSSAPAGTSSRFPEGRKQQDPRENPQGWDDPANGEDW